MRKFVTSTPIKNRFIPKQDEAIRAMTAHRSTADAIKNDRKEHRKNLIENLLDKMKPNQFTRAELEKKGTDELEDMCKGMDVEFSSQSSSIVEAMTPPTTANELKKRLS